MAQSHQYVNKKLLLELLELMETNNYIKINNEGFEVLKLVPEDIIKQAELKSAKEVRDSFISFIPTVSKALDDRLRRQPKSCIGVASHPCETRRRRNRPDTWYRGPNAPRENDGLPGN